MRIGIDIRGLSAGRHSGVEEYIYNLLPNLFQAGARDQFFLLYNSYKKSLPKFVSDWSVFPNVRIIEYHWPSKILNTSLWGIRRPFLNKMLGNIDVMFFPNITFFSISKSIPYVLTFHDLSFELFPNFYNPYRRVWHFMVNPAEKAREAAQLITVSNSTAQDLAYRYGIDNRKINPIYLGLSPLFKNQRPDTDRLPMTTGNLADEWRIRRNYRVPDNSFILYLGTIEPRKNLVSLIRAYNEFRKKSRLAYDLVIAGSKGWSYKEIFHAAETSPFKRNIYFPGPIADSDRPALYRMASLFVFPSFFEGFGLPPLEALASGTPVICSGSSSLLEVFGSHALLVNPHDQSELAWAIERALLDKKLRESLISQGLGYSQEFSWEETAISTLRVLHQASKSK